MDDGRNPDARQPARVLRRPDPRRSTPARRPLGKQYRLVAEARGIAALGHRHGHVVRAAVAPQDNAWMEATPTELAFEPQDERRLAGAADGEIANHDTGTRSFSARSHPLR